MMRIETVPSALGRWHGTLIIDEEKIHAVTGPRPGCVVRDLLNWMQYNLMEPHAAVSLEILQYE
jgi:hypothetical protein